MFDYDVNDSFYNEYFELLVNRVTHSTMSLERDLGNPDDSKNVVRLRDNMRAFKYLLNNTDKDLSEYIIIKVANLINASSPYISDNYRNTGKFIAETDIPISKPEDIQNDMNKLLNNYHNEWSHLDPYEREAKFHIEFIRIHPFEDGNGRTARLLLNFNLLRQKIHPIIITDDLDEYYKSYIRDESFEGMTNLFKIQAKKEQLAFDELQRQYNSNLVEEVRGKQ